MTRNFLLATALSLAIALGGLMMLGSGSAQASSYDSGITNATPVTDTEACSTTGYTYNGSYYPFTSDPNLAQVTSGNTVGCRANVAKPQSAPAMTFSRPTILA